MMVAGDEHKEEYPNFFYVDNTMPGIHPGAYDAMNKNLSLCGANIRIGPPLDAYWKICPMGLKVTCGIYMEEKDMEPYPARRVLSLDKAIVEMDELLQEIPTSS